jgi:hypothetical protein
MLNIISSKDASIWNLDIDVLALRFILSNDNQKYESYQFHFSEISSDRMDEKVLDFNTQQKIVNMITDPNPNLTIRHTWMKKNIYKTEENEILGYHIIENESKKEFTIYVEMKEVV